MLQYIIIFLNVLNVFNPKFIAKSGSRRVALRERKMAATWSTGSIKDATKQSESKQYIISC
jgi:hypothetical protein